MKYTVSWAYVHIIASSLKLCRDCTAFTQAYREKFVWSDNCIPKMKECQICAPVLNYTSLDHTFILDTDASNDSIRAVLFQVIGGQVCVIAYGSKALLKAEIS